LDVYSVTTDFPGSELYGLTSQLRRASSSVPTNLAEGTGRLSDLDFRRYVSIAFGSAHEVEYLLFLSKEVTYLPESEYIKLESQVKEIKRMLSGLIHSLTRRIYTIAVCIGILFIGAVSTLLTIS
jgi:four helix bundle protein